jgi:hypothetical protein
MAAAKVARARRYMALYGGDREQNATLQAADRLMCEHSDTYFINSWGWVRAEKEHEDASLVDVPFILWPDQIHVSDWLDERVRLAQVALLPKSREIGVTWEVCWKRLASWLFHGFSTLLVSQKEDLVDARHDMGSLFEKIRYGLGKMPSHLWKGGRPRYVDKHMLLKNMANRGEIRGESTHSGTGRGNRVQVMVFDEFAQVETPLAAKAWRASESVARSRWVIFNPGDKDHKTYELAENLSPDQVLRVPWRADPYRDEAWRASKVFPRGSLTEAEFRREYECSFEDISSFQIFNFQREKVRYSDADPAWQRVMVQARAAWDAPGGWDFGSGHSLLVCEMALIDWTDNPANFVIYFDDERVWQQEAWYTAARDVKEALGQYGGRKVHVGDPAGAARESDQTSWISKLNSGGVPLFALPAAVNAEQASLWKRKHFQMLLLQGRIRIHEAKCPVLLESLSAWKLDVPAGVSSLSFLNKRFVHPKKDQYSHPCEAAMYAVDYVMREAARKIAAKKKAAPDERSIRGEGSIRDWSSMYRSAVLGDDD